MAADPYRAATIIWRALLVGVVASGIVIPLLRPTISPLDPTLGPLLGRIILAAAAAQTLVLYVVRQRVLETPAALGGWIVCWALAEGVAMWGLLVATVAGSPLPAPIFVVWGAALLLAHRPQPAYFQVAS